MNEPLRVVTACTQRAGLLNIYEKQLKNAGIPLTVIPLDGIPHNVGNLGWKIDLFRRICDMFPRTERLVISDAWDVLFYGSSSDVISKIDKHGLLLAAERNCWPDAYLAEYFPGTTPWRFFNGGLTAGTREEILMWMDAIEKHASYEPRMIDQQWLNLLRIKRLPNISTSSERPNYPNYSILVPLDTRTELIYCMVQEKGELALDSNCMPINTLTGTHPNFIHFNGKVDSTIFQMNMMLHQTIAPRYIKEKQ